MRAAPIDGIANGVGTMEAVEKRRRLSESTSIEGKGWAKG